MNIMLHCSSNYPITVHAVQLCDVNTLSNFLRWDFLQNLSEHLNLKVFALQE